MIGTISRWGTRGYGFVTSDALEGEAWLHVKFIDEPDYEPQKGDRVEFEPERLADGRYQARRVRPLDAATRRASRTGGAAPLPAYPEARVAVKLALPPSLLATVPRSIAQPSSLPAALAGPALVPAAAPADVPSMTAAAAPSMAANLVPAVPATAGAPPALQLLAAAPPEAAPAEGAPESPRHDEPLGARLARARAEQAARAADLRTEAARLDEELARLAAGRRRIEERLAACSGDEPAREQAAVVAYLDDTRRATERLFTQRRLLVEAHEAARGRAIARSGLPTVLEYEDVRRRLDGLTPNGDALAQLAFRALERERRLTLRELAEAADRVAAAAQVRARFVAFQERLADGLPGALVVVAPIAATCVEPGAERGPLGRRALHLAYAFWNAAERAAREAGLMDAAVEHGRVGAALAARLPAVDAGILQLLLDEAWEARSELAGSLVPEVELVESVAPPFAPDELAAEEAGDAAGERHDEEPGDPRSLSAVAARLGLSVRDLVALLCDRGLPFADDVVEPGIEETLRALLGDAAPPSASPANDDQPGDDEAGSPELPGGAPDARSIASRMLRKLLRDRRVGGRHTRIENAYGHHFSDGEKDVARRVAEWLEKDGILLPKLNEGSHHISINPRRLRDVGQIVDGTWERGADLDALG